MDLFFTRYLTLRVILIATLVLCIPALFSGYLGDDYFQYALLSPDVSIPKAHDWSLFGLFSWIDTNPTRNQALMDLGVLPWWTFEGMRYQFWRPLAEISHWLDHQLWRDWPWLMHLHSLLLYLVLGYALHKLFRQLTMSTKAALLAVAVFMLDSTHGLTVGWLANRNAIMAGVFGVLCLQQYMDWRDAKGSQHFFLSLLWLVASLLSGEIGISTTCYLGAYALILDRQGRWKGLLTLWPYLLVSVVWFALYKMGHFGANNSDSNYIDPMESPLAFLLKALERVPVLLFSQLGFVPAEIYGFSPHPIPLYLAVAVLFLLGVGYLLWPVWQSSRHARFWTLGALFSLVPVSATVPADRNLLFVGIGASAVLGMLFEHLLAQLEPTKIRRVGIRVLIGIHLMLSPLLLPVFSYSPHLWSQLMGLPLARKIPVESSTESLLSFGIPMPIGMGATPMRFTEGLLTPDKLWTISTLQKDFTITRIDANTLHVHCECGMIEQLETNLRDLKRYPLKPHFKIRMTDMDLEVLKLDDAGHPTDLRLTFSHRRLDSTRILAWDGKQFIRDTVPAVGNSLDLNLSSVPQLAGTTEAY